MSIIGMTNMPEAKLAREAELHYATLALVTDYDVWHPGHDAVTVEAVVANLLKNVARAREVLRRAIPEIGKPCSAGCDRALQHAVITDPGLFPPRIRARLTPLIGRYFPRHLPRRASRD
jgi:5'-methylthioadenosine phosphorylase